MAGITNSTGGLPQSLLDSVNGGLPAGAAGAAAAKVQAKSKASEGGSADELQNSFLKLLVAQMNNQDPLNPMDNSQVTSQLAQISTVSGVTQLNTTLASMGTQMNAQQGLQAAALVGKGVLVPGGVIGVGSVVASDGTITKSATPFGFELPNDADKVTVEIKDPTGKVVRTVDAGALDKGVQGLTWDAKDDAGNTVADGKYSLAVTATADGKSVMPKPLHYSKVHSVVSNATGAPQLNVGTGTNVNLADVREIL